VGRKFWQRWHADPAARAGMHGLVAMRVGLAGWTRGAGHRASAQQRHVPASHGRAQVLYFVGAYRLLHDNNQLAVFAVRERAW
jgi:hypothetical protein